MAKASATQEPSMEEILASIRRIISDDAGGLAPPPSKSASHKAEPKEMAAAKPSVPTDRISEDDLDKLFSQAGNDEGASVLDLSESEAESERGDAEPLELMEAFEAEDPVTPFFEPENPVERPIVVLNPEPEPEIIREPRGETPSKPKTVRGAPKPRRRQTEPAPRHEAPAEETLEDESLVSSEAGASVSAAFNQLSHTVLSANAKTLDDIVKEMLRPMLKEWLDENLPALVERLVRAEIERVARGR